MVCEPEKNFSEDECISAASTIGGNLRSLGLVVIKWPNTPPGCSIDVANGHNDIHIGRNSTSINDGSFKPVCKASVSKTSHLDTSALEHPY